ncbi:MAG: hypothetical protein ABIJ21_08300 [Nanoarchaeota archaeon]
MVDDMTCCGESLEFLLIEKCVWEEYRGEAATCPECHTRYERKIGADFAYKRTEEGFICTRDGAKIMAGRIAHSVHDGPWKGSGGGRVEYEDVPYCPVHETKPDFHGKPREVGFKFDG